MSVYLDNAATTFPKPEAVYAAVDYAMRKIGVAPGRGGHRMGMEATRLVFETRETAASFFGVKDSSRIIFTHSATEGLNLGTLGLLNPGDHAITTGMEHNSLIRPLMLAAKRGVAITPVPCNIEGFVNPLDIAAAMRPNTRLVALSHCSNVTGAIQPIGDIAKIARKGGALFLLDAAQSAGSISLDVSFLGVDLLAAPGHKGLFAPQGTGLLYVAEGVTLNPLIVGGTGGYSSSLEQPDAMPERYESGTLNTPGIAGLKAGLDFIMETGLERIRGKESSLVGELLEGLRAIPRIKVHGPTDMGRRGTPVSFTVDGVDPAQTAFELDTIYDISVRAGLHCAPDAHRTIGTYPAGAVRVSPGYFNTEDDIGFFLKSLRDLAVH